MKQPKKQHILLGTIALFLGFFIIIQWRSFTNLSQENRDATKNIFREIQILKETNKNLKNEVTELSDLLESTTTEASALKSIDKEIEKYKMLAGEVPVYGPGLTIEINTAVDGIWLVDMMNELLNGGAEAISINGIRLTDKTQGLEILPQGQIFFHVNILELPYTFKAIGEPAELEKVISQESGIVKRMQDKYPGLNITIIKQERIDMEKI